MKPNDWKDKEISIPEGLEARLEQLIDSLVEQESQMKRRRLWTGLISAAACVALLLSTVVFFHTKQINDVQLTVQNIKNPELAYFEAQKALEKVSVKFNKGTSQLTFVSEKVKKTNQVLNKTFNKEIK
ncbi:MAG: hypothetical protein LBG15_16350 [Dysgonamonadaceae bacterium]|jgi:hypothetical protein|nr:hypothetical protein [Dysgonamonadaceae bacterium]